MFLTAGQGIHKYRLHSFELALREARIESCNLVKVSSIIPPSCEIISKEEGFFFLRPGEITYCVLSIHRTKRELQSIGSSIGLAIPSSHDSFGYVAELHDANISPDELKKQVEELAITMLSTTKGTYNTATTSPSETSSYTMNDSSEYSVSSICKHVTDTKAGVWTTALTAAIFLDQ